jgi:hypothetical protein
MEGMVVESACRQYQQNAEEAGRRLTAKPGFSNQQITPGF